VALFSGRRFESGLISLVTPIAVGQIGTNGKRTRSSFSHEKMSSEIPKKVGKKLGFFKAIKKNLYYLDNIFYILIKERTERTIQFN